jgi:hypothetical protein
MKIEMQIYLFYDFFEELFPAIRYIFFVCTRQQFERQLKTKKDAAAIGAKALSFRRTFRLLTFD